MPNWNKSKNTMWFKQCPSCNSTMYYSNAGNLTKAINANRKCYDCKESPSDEQKEKLRLANLGKKHATRKSNCKLGKSQDYKRECPSCATELGYSSKYGRDRANKQNALCNSCSCYTYKKNWKNVIKSEHIDKMAARKAGYENFSDYMNDIDNKMKYKRKVLKITKKQDISNLPNFDKLRGLCGVEGAYQLDHIISIDEGYRRKLNPEIIADIKNLQIIPWRDNLLKSNSKSEDLV